MTQIVEKEKIVESTVVVEVEKKVEVVQTQVVEVEKQVEVTPTPGPANPYNPDNLFKLSAELKDATKDCKAPNGAKYAMLTNAVAPFWTAAQIGASRASGEINVPITFQAPTAAEKLSQQLSMLETFVNDKYSAITFSAIDRDAPKPIIEKAVGQGIPVLVMDSDSTGSKRAMYIGMSDFDAGKSAGEAAKKIMGKGKVVGLVGYATAQNAQDRIAGVKEAFEGLRTRVGRSPAGRRQARGRVEQRPDRHAKVPGPGGLHHLLLLRWPGGVPGSQVSRHGR